MPMGDVWGNKNSEKSRRLSRQFFRNAIISIAIYLSLTPLLVSVLEGVASRYSEHYNNLSV